jgi:hypothetical protein
MAEIGKQKLHWFAHQTEEILVLPIVSSQGASRAGFWM